MLTLYAQIRTIIGTALGERLDVIDILAVTFVYPSRFGQLGPRSIALGPLSNLIRRALVAIVFLAVVSIRFVFVRHGQQPSCTSR